MADDDADDSTQNKPHLEDDDVTAHRWQFELDEMTPEERERALAAIRANVGGLQTAAWENNALVKAHMASLFDLQRREEQSLLASFIPKLQPFTSPVHGTWTRHLLAGLDRTMFQKIGSQILEQSGLREAFTGLREALLRGFPANLRDLPTGGLGQVSDIVRDEGIAMYGAPRQEIVLELIAAPNEAARRSILTARAPEISLDCRTLLQSCSSEWSRAMTPFALEALDSFDAGHTASAQALAASIVDTLLRYLYGNDRIQYTPSRKDAKKPRTMEALDSLPFRECLAVAPIWQVHQQFWVENGDPIPETFNRNASAHAVSAEQYTSVNAVQSLLYACTLLWFCDQEMGLIETAEADPENTADGD